MTFKTRLSVLLISTPILAFVLVGGLMGSAAERNDDESFQHLRVFHDVLGLVMQTYVEEVKVDSVMEGAMRGLADGLDARGRTHHLNRSYRTTREIMQFATLLYRLRLENEKDDDILVPDLLTMPNGAFPQIIPLTSPQDEIARAASGVAAAVG